MRWRASVLWNLSLLFMNSFKKTEVAGFLVYAVLPEEIKAYLCLSLIIWTPKFNQYNFTRNTFKKVIIYMYRLIFVLQPNKYSQNSSLVDENLNMYNAALACVS